MLLGLLVLVAGITTSAPAEAARPAIQGGSSRARQTVHMLVTATGFLGIPWGEVNWGNVLTGAAVLLTAIGLFLEGRRSRRDRVARSDAEKRGQAELVAAWEDHLSLDPQDYAAALLGWRGQQPSDTSTVGAVVFIRLRNASELPIYSLRYRVHAGVRGTFVGDLAVLPPDTVAEVAIPLPSPPRGEGAPPEIAFTDAGGRHWMRGATGALTPEAGMLFEADPGLSGAFDQDPTMTLPRPIRFGTAAYSETTATVVFPRNDPQAG